MASADSNKRFKAASRASIGSASSPSPAASLPAYQPPAQIAARDGSRLTVKAPPSKLRQATSGSRLATTAYADTPSESDTPAPAPRTARSTRNPRTVVEPDSDDLDEDMEDAEDEEVDEDEDEDDDEDDDGDDNDDDDAEGEADEEMQDENDDDSGGIDDDAEGEDDDADATVHLGHHPPPPIIKHERMPGQSKPHVTVTAPAEGPLKSVEDKEMEDEDDDDDEELSELDSAEGEEDDDDDDDSNDDEDDENSRSATPDLSKLTKRQRAAFQDEFNGGLMALSNEAQKKKHLTAEEHAMRRAEMARRRKNLSEKRNEEEKMDTINKLLKKPAPKRRTRAEIAAAHAAGGSPGDEDGDEEKPDALYVRWVHNREGSRIGVPEEWMDGPVGDVFRKPAESAGGMMIEEVA